MEPYCCVCLILGVLCVFNRANCVGYKYVYKELEDRVILNKVTFSLGRRPIFGRLHVTFWRPPPRL